MTALHCQLQLSNSKQPDDQNRLLLPLLLHAHITLQPQSSCWQSHPLTCLAVKEGVSLIRQFLCKCLALTWQACQVAQPCSRLLRQRRQASYQQCACCAQGQQAQRGDGVIDGWDVHAGSSLLQQGLRRCHLNLYKVQRPLCCTSRLGNVVDHEGTGAALVCKYVRLTWLRVVMLTLIASCMRAEARTYWTRKSEHSLTVMPHDGASRASTASPSFWRHTRSLINCLDVLQEDREDRPQLSKSPDAHSKPASSTCKA